MKSLALALLILTTASLTPSRTAFAAEKHHFEVVAVETGGTKFWLPSTFVVKKGDTVEFHLVSKITGASSSHGFAIDAFNIQEVVDNKGVTKSFVADKSGIFTIRCQLHPAHVGGQLIVQE